MQHYKQENMKHFRQEQLMFQTSHYMLEIMRIQITEMYGNMTGMQWRK